MIQSNILREYIREKWSNTSTDTQDDHPGYVYEIVQALYKDSIEHIRRCVKLDLNIQKRMQTMSIGALTHILESSDAPSVTSYIETIESLYIGMSKKRSDYYAAQFIVYGDVRRAVYEQYNDRVITSVCDLNETHTQWVTKTKSEYEELCNRELTLKELLYTERITFKQLSESMSLSKKLDYRYRHEIHLLKIPTPHSSFKDHDTLQILKTFKERIGECEREIIHLDQRMTIVKKVYVKKRALCLTDALFDNSAQHCHLSSESKSHVSHDENMIVFCIMAKNDALHHRTLRTILLLCKVGYLTVYDAMKMRVYSYVHHVDSTAIIRVLPKRMRQCRVTLGTTSEVKIRSRVKKAITPCDKKETCARKCMTHHNRRALHAFTASAYHYDMIFAIQTCLPHIYIEFRGLEQEKSSELYRNNAANSFIMFFRLDNYIRDKKVDTPQCPYYKLAFTVEHLQYVV